MFARVLACAALLSTAGTAVAAEPKQPTGKWVAEFADHQCILSRAYGAPNEVLILAFQKLPMRPGVELNVLKTDKRTAPGYGRARVGFLKGSSVEAAFGAYRVGPKVRKISVGIEDESYRSAAETGTVSLSIPKEIEESFAVPGFGPALKVLDQCVVNLGEAWGISKDQQTLVGRLAKVIEPEALFDSNDYPDRALKEDASGKTIVRYVVDEAGRSSDCVVLKSSGNKSLDLATCSKLLQRARFEPALDLQGRPMRSISVMVVNWLIMIS